ncbi:MAG: phosphatase [Lachnospiraceae bacterium]|nr:phosphatase [Lachnospiraceae bacterium]
MNYVLDTHTHTIASGHAYSTISEMAKSASEKGLKLLGITEHAPLMPGSCQQIYFSNLKVVPREMFGIQLMFGAELNILDKKGHIDLNNFILDKLDVRIASLHTYCIESGSVADNTSALTGAIKNPRIDIIGHPDDGTYPVDYEELVSTAKEYKTLLEVNNNSLDPTGSRKNGRENITKMLSWCKKLKVPVIMNSDAHVFTDVGRHDFSETVIKELDFPEELIVNRSVEAFLAALKTKRSAFLTQ